VKTLISDKLNNSSLLGDDHTIEEYVDVEGDLEESKDESSEVFLGYMDEPPSNQLNMRTAYNEAKTMVPDPKPNPA